MLVINGDLSIVSLIEQTVSRLPQTTCPNLSQHDFREVNWLITSNNLISREMFAKV